MFLLLISVLSFSHPASGEVILNDDFLNSSLVDLTKTTARVDTVNHCVMLPWVSLTNSISAMEYGIGYAVATKDGVTLYEYDDGSGTMAVNSFFSCPWATDATGVSIRQDNLNVWSITPNSIAYYRFNGAGMSNDPALKAIGLNSVLSVAAFKTRDSALLLQAEGNKAKITRYDAGITLGPAEVFSPDIEDPVSISMVNDSPDFRLFTKNAAYYFMYDDAGGAYVEDPAKRITGLAEVISAGSDDSGNTILTGSDPGYYLNDDTGRASRVDVFSPGPAANPVAVSLKPGTCEQVFLDENGYVQWWTHDDAAGRMVRVTNLEISGLNLNRGYAHPGEYHSVVLNGAASYDAACLTITGDTPACTSISYFVSSDGGSSFVPVTPGIWAAVPMGSDFVVKAVLDTTDRQQTPRIFHVNLEVEEDLVLEGNVSPYPAERGRNVAISARAVRLTTGDPVPLDSCSARYPLETKVNNDPALPEGQLPAVAAMAHNPGTGFWEHTFTMPEKTVDGRWPDDGVYQVAVTGTSGLVQKEAILNLEINGHILRKLIVRTLSW